MKRKLKRWAALALAATTAAHGRPAAAKDMTPNSTHPAEAPRINGPAVFAVRPGTPFLYSIPATGRRPMKFGVADLPQGLSVEPGTGIITGVAPRAGIYRVTLQARNANGAAEKALRIVCGEQLCLTPPMGWNSWNAVGREVNEQVVRETADALVASGLKDAGYQYVVIDDHWHGPRNGRGELTASVRKFPGGMKALAAYVHGKGLKFGIYSDAGDRTCGGEPGSYGFEERDAQMFADWGVDYLKYDYCNAPDDLEEAVRRYARMGQALQRAGRSIVFSVCEWGQRSPWLWAGKAGGHLWRTSFDVGDMWDTPHNTHSCIGILASVDAVANLGHHAGPGGWNDPDMLVIGLRNRGFIKGGGCSRDEYETQMALWCLLAAPLMIGCDIRHIDGETQRLLANPELVALDQDELGQPGVRVARTGSTEVWRRTLAGGAIVLALLNRGESEAEITADWQALGLQPDARLALRDLWLGADVGVFNGSFRRKVRPHAALLVRTVPAP